MQEESEVLCKYLRNHNYAQFERHLQALTDFYKQASSQTDFNGMYRAMMAIEKEVMNICEKRYLRCLFKQSGIPGHFVRMSSYFRRALYY